MTTRERKLLTRTALLGFFVTLLVLVGDQYGALQPLETWLSDRRVRHNQRFNPPPTDKLVHLDVGDPALDVVGRWPWDRSKLALIVDELRIAGAKALAFDVILTDPQEIDLVRNEDGTISEIDHDAQLATSIKRFGNVLSPIAFEKATTHSITYQTMHAALLNDLEIDPDSIIPRLREWIDHKSDKLTDKDQSRFIRARSRAMYERVFVEVDQDPAITVEQLTAKLLPKTPASTATALTRLLEKQLQRVHASISLQQFARENDVAAPLRKLPEGMAPISKIGEASGSTGFVYYEPDEDGAVRQIVLWINHNNRLYPQLGLALACAYLDVDIRDIEIHEDRVVVPRPADAGGPLTIPVFSKTDENTKTKYAGITDIAWFGKAGDWTTMYDPTGEDNAQHMPITQVWSAIESRQRIEKNNVVADQVILFMYEMFAPEKLEAYEKNPPAKDDIATRLKLIQALAADEFLVETAKMYKQDQADGTKLDEMGETFMASHGVMGAMLKELPLMQEQYEGKRAKLAELLQDKAVLIGWTATGAIADFVPTPLHALCPGVVVHGVMFNSVLNGEVWTRAPHVYTSLLVLLLGLLTIAAVCLLSPVTAAVVSTAVAVIYLLVNGILLFDYHNVIVGASGPLMVVAAVWGGGTLFRFIVERAERARITARFSSYVDPALVNYVIEHPEKAKLDGEEKELSVVFTDLQGFTTISELLGSRTVGILNEYMGLMTDSIRERDGYVNKFLGDGIMFFYGAPLDNPEHAVDAVATSVKMQELIVPFNAKLAKQELPEVFVRVGVGTGDMIVGDCGSDDASDYTVLGDVVNSAARLESANKQTGTWIMCNELCHDMLEGRFLCRTIGELQVVGKSEGMKVYNPLDWADKATDAQREMVRLFDDVVNTYVDGQFKRCIEAIDVYEKAFEPYKLSKTYRELCEQYIAQPPEEFLGRIVLSSK